MHTFFKAAPQSISQTSGSLTRSPYEERKMDASLGTTCCERAKPNLNLKLKVSEPHLTKQLKMQQIQEITTFDLFEPLFKTFAVNQHKQYHLISQIPCTSMSPLTTQNMHVYGPVTPTMIKESEKQSVLKALIKAGGGETGLCFYQQVCL